MRSSACDKACEIDSLGRTRLAQGTMRGWIELWICCLCVACPLVGGAAVSAGTAKADITPPLPAAFDLLQVATEVAHPLYARVLYLSDKDDEVVLVATDYEGILRTAYDQLRNAISRAVHVPRSSIIINANHSHNAPWIKAKPAATVGKVLRSTAPLQSRSGQAGR